MKFEQFEIGNTFFASAGFKWLCTDKGTRTITAIMLSPDKDKSWFIGPPYAVNEEVFDEYDISSCYLNDKDMFMERIEHHQVSSHPNFQSKDVFKMLKEKMNTNTNKYSNENLLKRDRVNENGEILHPYCGILMKKGWYIKTFEIFSRKYSKMHENDFMKLPYRSEEAMQKRADNFNKLVK